MPILYVESMGSPDVGDMPDKDAQIGRAFAGPRGPPRLGRKSLFSEFSFMEIVSCDEYAG